MNRKRVWRYYCEHCRKGGCSAASIGKHERGCTRNPHRECGMCKKARIEQRPTSELLAALEAGGVEQVLSLAGGCPACVMAAIHALRAKEPLCDPSYHDGSDSNYIPFDYTPAARAFWSSVDEMESR